MILFPVIMSVKVGIGRITLSRKRIEDTFEVLNDTYVTYEKNNDTIFIEFLLYNWTE